jgi:hypothetical protein
MAPGPGLWTFRIWWHAIANLIGSFIFAMALYQLWRERVEIRATYLVPSGSTAKEPARLPRSRPVADPATAV